MCPAVAVAKQAGPSGEECVWSHVEFNLSEGIDDGHDGNHDNHEHGECAKGERTAHVPVRLLYFQTQFLRGFRKLERRRIRLAHQVVAGRPAPFLRRVPAVQHQNDCRDENHRRRDPDYVATDCLVSQGAKSTTARCDDF